MKHRISSTLASLTAVLLSATTLATPAITGSDPTAESPAYTAPFTIDEMSGNGPHTLVWRNIKDNVESEGEDCGWVADYNWASDFTATQTTEVPVPYAWLRGYYRDIVDEYATYEATANAIAANGVNTVWECYVSGISPVDPAARFLADISLDEFGQPLVTWMPDLGDDRDYAVEGKASLLDEWDSPDDDSRFFRVLVAMPGGFGDQTITFDGSGGSAVASITSAYGDDLVEPAPPTKQDLVFAGWSPSFPAKMPLHGATLTAQWTPATYCVIDISGGSSASAYPVTYLAEPPDGGFNTDEYKTTKLVLKRIEAGSFMMGENQDVSVTLTKPYIIGLFEVTQKQWQLVTGGNPSAFSGDKRPVEVVSYNAIRGSSDGAQWPSSNAVDSSSFLGKLRARTGLDFDLPTEAQWEYACHAGTTTAYSYGNSPDGNYMWYTSNSSSQTHEVGTKNPNSWGLYDMHGNVAEWCLDWYGSLVGGTDPKGSFSVSDYRVRRGGAWNSNAAYCILSVRAYSTQSYESYDIGFRLARTLTE